MEDVASLAFICGEDDEAPDPGQDRSSRGGWEDSGRKDSAMIELLHCFDDHHDNQHDHQAADHDGIYDKDKMRKPPEPNGYISLTK